MSVKKSLSLNNAEGAKAAKRGRYDRCFSFMEVSVEPGKTLKEMDSFKLKAEINRWAKAVVAYAWQVSDKFGSSRSSSWRIRHGLYVSIIMNIKDFFWILGWRLYVVHLYWRQVKLIFGAQFLYFKWSLYIKKMFWKDMNCHIMDGKSSEWSPFHEKYLLDQYFPSIKWW